MVSSHNATTLHMARIPQLLGKWVCKLFLFTKFTVILWWSCQSINWWHSA